MQFLATSNIYKYVIGVEDEDRDLVGDNAVKYLFPTQNINFQVILQLVSSILCIR